MMFISILDYIYYLFFSIKNHDDINPLELFIDYYTFKINLNTKNRELKNNKFAIIDEF